jgi:hypothetical protein
MLPFIPTFLSKNVTFRPNGATSINVGQCPTNRIPLENKALKGRKPNEDNHFQNKNNPIAVFTRR